MTVRHWLLELDLGEIFRFSVEEVSVTRSDGDTVVYLPGLSEPSVALDVAAGLGEASVGVEILSDTDWAEIVARGVPLEGRTATLLRWTEGDVYERARVVLRGVVRGVSYGARHETLGFTIVRALVEYGEIYPPSQAVIDTATWPITGGHLTPEEAAGTAYPIVIGSPGINPGGSAYGAVQCFYGQVDVGAGVATSYVVVGDGTIAASSVRLYVRDEKLDSAILVTPTTRTVSQVTDLLGRTVSVITPESTTTNTVEDVRFFVGFPDAAGGGLRDRYDAPLRGAGDVIAWVLYDHNSYPVDRGRVEAVRERLNAYKIDTVITEPTNLWDWVLEEVSPVLPIEWRESTHGLYPAIWPWTASDRDVVAHYDATRPRGNVARVGAISSVSDEIYNEITVEYGPRTGGDGWRFRRIATSTARATARSSSPNDDERVRGSAHLAESQRVYGLRQLTVQLGAVWDHTTAELALRDLIARYAWPRRRVTYAGGWALEERSAGDVVRITDPEVYLDEEIAVVLNVTPSGADVQIELLLLDHPIARLRRTT